MENDPIVTYRRAVNWMYQESLLLFITKAFEIVSPGDRYDHNWHIVLLASELENCEEGKCLRLLVNIAPRTLKSIITSVIFPAWVLGRNPKAKIIVASYGSDLAQKHALDCRRLMQSPFYKSVFPNMRLASDQNTKEEFHTTCGGYRLAVSVGGSMTGRGGDYLIIDDPMKAEDAMSVTGQQTVQQWYSQTFYQRLNNRSQGRIILAMQRLHEEDLTGFVLPREEWRHVCLPAEFREKTQFIIKPRHIDQFIIKMLPGDLLHPSRLSKQELGRIQKIIGSSAYNAQYLQQPIPADGNLIKLDWINYFDYLPSGLPLKKVLSIDSASKAGDDCDYTVLTAWYKYGDNFYLIDLMRKRVDYPALRKLIIETAHKTGIFNILIEDKGSGIHLLQDLNGYNFNLIPYKPNSDKLTRMAAQTSKMEAGRVFIKKDAAWTADLIDELLKFPQSKYDDQVDSVSQALDWLGAHQRKGGFFVI